MAKQVFNPYRALMAEAREFERSVIHPHTVDTAKFTLVWLRERTVAADQLGYDTVITCPDLTKDELVVVFKKRPLARFW